MQPEAGSRGMLAVVLAGQRDGVVDPLAAAAGVSHKCLVPIGGLPLITHVVKALQAAPRIARIRIVVEPGAVEQIRPHLSAGAVQVEFIAARPNIVDSVHAATHDADQPTILTTADNVLLTPGAVAQVEGALRAGADVVFSLASKTSVLAAHEEGQRRFYRFRDDEYSNCNLYGIGGARALHGAEMFRSGGQFAKHPGRMLAAIGLFNVLLFRFGWLTLDGGMRRLSKRLKLRATAVVLGDGAHAVDVDNERTFRVAGLLLERRADPAASRG